MGNHFDPPSQNRFHGLDLLRFLAMLMVVVHHVQLHGGLMAEGIPTEALHATLFLRAFCIGAVPTFVVLSGFLLYVKPFSWRRIIRLWLYVLFVAKALDILCWATTGDVSLLRMGSGRYWFWTIYVWLVFLTPILNEGLKRIPIQTEIGVLVAYSAFSFLPRNCGPGFGHSLMWFILLYLVGASIRKHLSDLANCRFLQYPLMIWILCSLGNFLVLLSWDHEGKCIFRTEASPLTLLGSASILLYFATRSTRGWLFTKLSAVSFGVYLIHEHPFIRETFIRGTFAPIAELHPAIIPIATLGCAVAIYLLCGLLDEIRIQMGRMFSPVEKVVMRKLCLTNPKTTTK